MRTGGFDDLAPFFLRLDTLRRDGSPPLREDTTKPPVLHQYLEEGTLTDMC